MNRRQALSILSLSTALLSLSLIGYYWWELSSKNLLKPTWSTVDQYPWLIGLVITFLIAVILTFVGLREWLGFGKDGEKTGLDLLQFLVTASIPILVAFGGIWFTEQRAQDEAIQGYLEQMGNLLLEENLRTLQEDDEARVLAQARTSMILSRLAPPQKVPVVMFLQESKLIQKDNPVIDVFDIELSGASFSGIETRNLSEASLKGAIFREADLEGTRFMGADLEGTRFMGADLRGVNFEEANLEDTSFEGVNLGGVNLQEAVLWRANLRGADLRGARLEGADLWGADLSGAKEITTEKLEKEAKSLTWATMPDGTTHD